MGMDEDRTFESFGAFLEYYYNNVFVPDFYSKHGRGAREIDFARWLEIENQNLSQYKLNKRKPSVDQADQLAKKLGARVYDVLGYPQRMPNDKLLNYIANHWAGPGGLDEADRKELFEIVKNRLEDKRKKKSKPDLSTT